jgi:hypothetical protein
MAASHSGARCFISRLMSQARLQMVNEQGAAHAPWNNLRSSNHSGDGLHLSQAMTTQSIQRLKGERYAYR